MLCIDAVWFLQNTAHMYWLVATPSHSAKSACHCLNVSFCIYTEHLLLPVFLDVFLEAFCQSSMSAASPISEAMTLPGMMMCPHTSSSIYATVSWICEVRFWDIGIFVSLWMHSTEHPLFCRDTFVAPTHIRTPAGWLGKYICTHILHPNFVAPIQ